MSVESTPGQGENRLPSADLLATMPENPSDEQVLQLVTTMVDTSYPQLAETFLDVRQGLSQRRGQAESQYRHLSGFEYPHNVAEQAGPEQLIPLLMQRDTAQRDLLNMDIAGLRFNLAAHRYQTALTTPSGEVNQSEVASLLGEARTAIVEYGVAAYRASPQTFRESAGRRVQEQRAPQSIEASIRPPAF